MLHSLNELKDYKILAIDGPIGQLTDLYFDDETWVIRYLIIDTGTWLSSRKVMISPISVSNPNWPDKTLPVMLNKDQIKNSPQIDLDLPVCRQHEASYLGYYGYPYYWQNGGIWGDSHYPSNSRPADDGNPPDSDVSLTTAQQGADIHLRSSKEIEGYHVKAVDGEIGHISGILIDETSWAVRYLIADTSNWWIGHKVLIAPQWITDISWPKRSVSVDLTLQALQEAPSYDSRTPLEHQLELQIQRHYEQFGRWPAGDRQSEHRSAP